MKKNIILFGLLLCVIQIVAQSREDVELILQTYENAAIGYLEKKVNSEYDSSLGNKSDSATLIAKRLTRMIEYKKSILEVNNKILEGLSHNSKMSLAKIRAQVSHEYKILIPDLPESFYSKIE